MSLQVELRKLMQSEWARIRAKNPSFSLRAFARRLGLYSSTVSEILNGKRAITAKMAARILGGLNVSPDESSRILLGMRAGRKVPSADERGFVLLSMDEFHVVSDWHYFAILSLADCEGFRGDPDWIAKRLRLSRRDAQVALEKLERLALLVRDESGALRASGKQFDTGTDVANFSLRKHHYQNLDLARRSLEEDELLNRDFSFINMAVDPARLPEMKRRIREFRDSFCAEFEAGPRKEVFKICVQLFPLTQLKGENSQ